MERSRLPIMKGLTPFSMFIFSSLGVVIIGFIFQIIGLLTATLFFDVTFFDLTAISENITTEQLNAIKYLQIFGALGTFIFSSFFLSFLYTGSWTGYFRFSRDIESGRILLLVLIMISALPLVNYLTELNMGMDLPFDRIETYLKGLEEQTEDLMMLLVKADNIGPLLINLLMIALIPAVGEELVFRGLLQKHLENGFRNGHIAVIVTSVLFSLAHFQIYSFLPRFFLGLLLGYMYYYGKNLWYPIFAHLLNNGLGVMFYYYQQKGKIGETLDNIGTNTMVPVAALASLLIVVGLMYVWSGKYNFNRYLRSD